MSMLQRILEAEAMETPEEALEYDRADFSGPNAAFVQRLIDLGAAGRMLDIGTGPGHIPVLVCQKLPQAQVTAIDLSQTMLDLAARRVAAAGLNPRITLQRVDAKSLPFPDGSFDAVFSNTILHHIPDPRPFLREARRVLNTSGGGGGVMLIRDLFRPDDRRTLDSLVSTHAADATPRQRQLFADSLHAALTPDELRQVAREADLSEAQVVIDTDRHMSLQIARR